MRYFPLSTREWLKLVTTKITYSDQGLEAIVRGTYTFDFMKGGPGELWICDFHWEIVSIETDEKYISPHNKTELTIIEGVDFNYIDKAFLESQEYKTNKLSGQTGESCDVYPGRIIAFKRKDGIYVKMIVQEVDYTLKFKYQTFE